MCEKERFVCLSRKLSPNDASEAASLTSSHSLLATMPPPHDRDGTARAVESCLSVPKKQKKNRVKVVALVNEGFERGLSAGADADAQSTELIDDCSIFLGRSWSGRARHAAFVPPEASIVNLGELFKVGSSPAGHALTCTKCSHPAPGPGQSPSPKPPVPFLHHRIFHTPASSFRPLPFCSAASYSPITPIYSLRSRILTCKSVQLFPLFYFVPSLLRNTRTLGTFWVISRRVERL